MTVRIKTVKGDVEWFMTANYTIANLKEMHPDILDVKIFTDLGKRLYHKRRPFQRFYKRFKYKPLTQQEEQPAETPAPEPAV